MLHLKKIFFSFFSFSDEMNILIFIFNLNRLIEISDLIFSSHTTQGLILFIQGRSLGNCPEKYIVEEEYLRSKKHILSTQKSIIRLFLPKIMTFNNLMRSCANLKVDRLVAEPQPFPSICCFQKS